MKSILEGLEASVVAPQNVLVEEAHRTPATHVARDKLSWRHTGTDSVVRYEASCSTPATHAGCAYSS